MSVPFRADDAVRWTGGTLARGAGETRFDGASIDSRSVGAGELFVAIAGPRHDGHRFADAAAARGAAGLLVERGRPLPAGLPDALAVIEVTDTTRALGDLACGHRAGFEGPVVAITGSNGKTTTKEMCAAILSVRAPCLKNQGNLNNQYGLPLTLLSRAPEHASAVVELGMNHRGEIAALARIADRGVGVVTNVGLAHVEHLGSREEIAREKGDLVAALPEEGTAVLNADDPLVAAMAGRCRGRVVLYGSAPSAHVRPRGVRRLGGRGFAFELAAPEGAVPVEVAGLGDVTVQNALAAAAGALAAGASLACVAGGLASYEGARGRLERRLLPSGAVVVDDSYNANPQSMEVALRMLASLDAKGRRLAVLGDMGELGDASAAAHRDMGRLAAGLGIDLLLVLGRFSDDVAAGAREGGMDPSRVRVERDCESAADRLRDLLRGDDAVLVKGSRSMGLERVVDALCGEGR